MYVFNCNLPVAEVVPKKPIKKVAEGRPPTGMPPNNPPANFVSVGPKGLTCLRWCMAVYGGVRWCMVVMLVFGGVEHM